MALPVTISGLVHASASITVTRPFISSAGNVYVIGRESSTLGAYKATDPTSSFSAVGTSPSLTVINNLNAVQVGDVLHIVTADGSVTTSVNYKYHTFDMATDAWVITNEVIVSAEDTDATNLGALFVGIGVRSDGDVIVLYMGDSDAIMGTAYTRVDYARREGGTWTVGVEVDPSLGEVHYTPIDLVMGSSDRAHLFYSTNATTTKHRSLSSANALGSVTNTILTSISATDTNKGQLGASYVSGADTKVALVVPDNTVNDASGWIVTSAENPSFSTSNDITGTTGTNVGKYAHSLAADGTTLWHTFVGSDGDIWTQSNEDEAGWSAPEEFYDDTNGVERLKTNVYTRDGSVVLAIIYENNTDGIKYHEKQLSAGTTDAAFSMAATAAVTMAGASTASSNLSSTATATQSWNGAATATSNLSAAAAAVLTWTGAEILAAVEADWSSTAAATVTWGGTGLYPAAFDSDAAATVTFNGIATAASNLDSDALAVLTWTGASTATSNVDSDAAAALTWNGAALAYADWTSTATADLQWVGEQLTIAASDWSSAATASLTWNGISTASSNLDADAAATLTWNGVSTAASNLSSDSAAVLTWNGIATAASSWSAAAVSSVTFNGTGLYPASLDADAAASLTWNGAEIAVTGSAWSAASTADVTWGGVTIASGYIDTDIDAFATLRMTGATLRSADFDADATASVTWDGVAQAPDIEAAAFESAATATLTMTGESSVTATWNAVAAAALTMAGTEVTAAAWSAAAVATITFTGQEVGETGQFDIDAAASVSWGGADATPGVVVDLNGWRVKADMARELEELEEEDILTMLSAAVAYMEQCNGYY